MNVLMFFLVICVIICSILILFIHCYNKFQNCFIRLNEAEANIDSVLRKRFDLLNKSILRKYIIFRKFRINLKFIKSTKLIQ